MKRVLSGLLLSGLFFISCTSSNQHPAAESTKEDALQNSINQFKETAQNGDLITRLGNDILSYQIKLLNDSSKLYSHAGLVIERGGEKWVAHIAPAEAGADTIQFTPIDSFINPVHNLTAALYRYKLSEAEKDSVRSLVEGYKASDIRFDRYYDLATKDKMYCSEMISDVLQKASSNRIAMQSIPVPKHLLKLVVAYFKKEKNAEKIIAQRQYIPIDKLYKVQGCSIVMQLNLQTTP
jgi:hypothetical protein